MSASRAWLINYTPTGSTYSDTTPFRGTKAVALERAERLAGDGAEFVKKGEGPAGYVGAKGAAYVTEDA
jgi:hypothetical protein